MHQKKKERVIRKSSSYLYLMNREYCSTWIVKLIDTRTCKHAVYDLMLCLCVPYILYDAVGNALLHRKKHTINSLSSNDDSTFHTDTKFKQNNRI